MKLSVEFLSGADADLQAAFNLFEDYREGFDAFLAEDHPAENPNGIPSSSPGLCRRRYPGNTFTNAAQP